MKLSVQYVGNKYIDIGEKIHIRANVKAINEEEASFVIRGATYELLDPDGNLEDTGECTIEEHILDALISPQKTGTYVLKFIYEVADEIWIDPIRLRVN